MSPGSQSWRALWRLRILLGLIAIFLIPIIGLPWRTIGAAELQQGQQQEGQDDGDRDEADDGKEVARCKPGFSISSLPRPPSLAQRRCARLFQSLPVHRHRPQHPSLFIPNSACQQARVRLLI